MSSVPTQGQVALAFPISTVNHRGQTWFVEQSMIVDCRVELFGRIAALCPPPGLYIPDGKTGGFDRIGEPFGGIAGLIDDAYTTPGRAGIWTNQPTTLVDETADVDPDRPSKLWTFATNNETRCFNGDRIEAITTYGAGQDVTWRLSGDMLYGWWGDNTILAAIVMAVEVAT